MRARQRDRDTRLHDAEAAHHTPQRRVELRTIEWMRHRAHEQRRRARRQHRIRVERDHVAHLANYVHVADDCRESIVAVPEDELIELRELAALALPSHPYPFLRVPP